MRIKTLRNKEVSSLVKEGKWRKREEYLLCYRQNTVQRFAFSSTKKIKKKVTRNKIKRILKEIVRKNLFQIPPGEYLLVGTEIILNIKHSDLQERLLRDLKELAQYSPVY